VLEKSARKSRDKDSMAGKNSTSYKLRALRFHVVRFLLERTIEDAIAGDDRKRTKKG
jgi:hypothetical protein